MSKRLRVFLVSAICLIIVGLGVTIIFGVLSVTAFSTRQVPGPKHPTAAVMALAKKYMVAIADGNAAEARSIDKAAYPTTSGVDFTTFIDSDALKNATARITNLKYALGGNEDDDAWVETSYTLAGKTYKTELLFDWDSRAKAWVLHTDIAQLVNVQGYTTDIDGAPLPFSLSGVHAAASPTGLNGLYTDSLVYPAVYPLVVDIDPSKLANPATPTTTTLLVPPDPYKGGTANFLLAAPLS